MRYTCIQRMKSAVVSIATVYNGQLYCMSCSIVDKTFQVIQAALCLPRGGILTFNCLKTYQVAINVGCY